MSSVTNVILHHSVCEPQDVEDGPFLPVNQLNNELEPRVSFQKVDQYAGGSKVFEAEVYLAAFNHTSTDEIVRIVESKLWKYPKEVQLFIMEQEDDGFTEHRIA